MGDWGIIKELLEVPKAGGMLENEKEAGEEKKDGL